LFIERLNDFLYRLYEQNKLSQDEIVKICILGIEQTQEEKREDKELLKYQRIYNGILWTKVIVNNIQNTNIKYLTNIRKQRYYDLICSSYYIYEPILSYLLYNIQTSEILLIQFLNNIAYIPSITLDDCLNIIRKTLNYINIINNKSNQSIIGSLLYCLEILSNKYIINLDKYEFILYELCYYIENNINIINEKLLIRLYKIISLSIIHSTNNVYEYELINISSIEKIFLSLGQVKESCKSARTIGSYVIKKMFFYFH